MKINDFVERELELFRKECNFSSGENYSRHNERTQMIQKLETMMQNAQTEEQRRAIKKCIDEM